MSNESKRINFFIGINTMHEYLEKYVVDQSISKDAIYFDCAFTVDIIEGPHRLFYRGSEEQLELRVDTRNSLYQVDEQESRKKASVTINGEGEGAVSADGDFQGVVNIYVSFCTHFASYLREKGAFEEYHDLDPERQGVLVEMNDGDIELKLVSGKERPNLVCETLTGEMQLMRPYESDFMKSTLIGMMPLEMKERAAESGDTDMMNHLFEYYMGHVETPQNDLNSMMKLMKALKAASGEEDELPDLEKEENTRNPEKAFYWLKKLAESGDAGAMNALSIFYTKAFGKERDFKAAAEWRKKAAENGYEAAEGQENVLLMIAETEEKAKSGDTDAQVTYAKALALLAQENPELGEENDRVEAFQWAKKSASKYNLEGIFTLASFYDNGTGTTKDAVKAFRLFERAANKGHAPSQARLGMMYFQGEGTQENPEAAFEWSKRAAEAGDANGMSNLAACYLLGKGVEQDQGKAVEWLQKAAELGDEGAKGLLEKLGVSLKSQQQPRTLEEAVKAAEQGSVPAMKMLAQYYINRPGGKDDLHEAYKWAKMAADQGDEESNQLCVQLEDFLSGKSKFVPFEETKSNAEAGDAGAQKILADYYATGYETERDLVKALYWMRKAAASGDARFADHAKGFVDSFSDIEEIVSRAEQGDPQAQAQLAEKYVGISQNYPNYEQEKGQRDAFEMAKKSASAGDPLGMFVLGMCYENGYGTEADFDRAFELYKESAELGNPRGELSLSQCYLTGRGTQIDADATMEWLEKAEAHGNPEAEQVRGLYRQLMPMVAMDKLGDGANSGGTDPVQGARLMERAAELGSAEAQGFLGMMYINGNHVENDFETGILWLQKAAENGNQRAAGALDKYDRPEAYNAAANMEFAKKELADKEKVFRLMKHAAEGGLAVSQNSLGLLYMKGYGVLPDYEAGMEWFRKAADQGNENAIRSIQKYESPDGLFMGAMVSFEANRKAGISDGSAVFELLKKAADLGSPEALNMMGVFYADPDSPSAKDLGIDKDYLKAEELFQAAANSEGKVAEAAKLNLKELERVASGTIGTNKPQWKMMVPRMGASKANAATSQASVIEKKTSEAKPMTEKTVDVGKKATESKTVETQLVKEPVAIDRIRARYKRAAGLIACSMFHVVAVKTDGTVIATGRNDDGQCNVAGWRNIVAVDCDESGTVGLERDGTVRYAGKGIRGESQCRSWSSIIEVAMSNNCVFGLKKDGTVVCTPKHGSGNAPDVTTWSNIKEIRRMGECIVGIDENGKAISVNRNYYGRTDKARYISDEVIDAAVGGFDDVIVLKKDGSCYSFSTEQYEPEKIAKVYLMSYNAHVALLTNGKIIQGKWQQDNKIAQFISDHTEEVVIAASGSSVKCAFLTEDGRIYIVGNEGPYKDEVKPGEPFGKGFRLFESFNKIMDEEEKTERQKAEKKAEQERLKTKGVCQYCGGDFKKGLFGSKCARCGKKKDY